MRFAIAILLTIGLVAAPCWPLSIAGENGNSAVAFAGVHGETAPVAKRSWVRRPLQMMGNALRLVRRNLTATCLVSALLLYGATDYAAGKRRAAQAQLGDRNSEAEMFAARAEFAHGDAADAADRTSQRNARRRALLLRGEAEGLRLSAQRSSAALEWWRGAELYLALGFFGTFALGMTRLTLVSGAGAPAETTAPRTVHLVPAAHAPPGGDGAPAPLVVGRPRATRRQLVWASVLGVAAAFTTSSIWLAVSEHGRAGPLAEDALAVEHQSEQNKRLRLFLADELKAAWKEANHADTEPERLAALAEFQALGAEYQEAVAASHDLDRERRDVTNALAAAHFNRWFWGGAGAASGALFGLGLGLAARQPRRPSSPPADATPGAGAF